MTGKFPRISGLAERFTEIQRALGYTSIRAFTEALLDPGFWEAKGMPPPSVSQETIRQYHSPAERRDPPASYLVAIAERFEVSPDWLLYGHSGIQFMEDVRRSARQAAAESVDPRWPAALAGAPVLQHWPKLERLLFLELLTDYAASFEGWHGLMGHLSGLDELAGTEERCSQAWEALARDLDGMLNIQCWSKNGSVTRREFSRRVRSLIHAVQLRIPEPGEGPNIYLRFETLDPEYRALAEAMEGEEREAHLAHMERPLTEIQPSMWAWERYKK